MNILAGLGLGIPNWFLAVLVIAAIAIVLMKKGLDWAVLLLALVILLLLVGCRFDYENDNGPRGPERFSVGGAWPKPLSCEGKPEPTVKAP